MQVNSDSPAPNQRAVGVQLHPPDREAPHHLARTGPVRHEAERQAHAGMLNEA
jgi:hypothetical protein